MTFTITQNQNQYLTYCLKDEEADAYLEVVPARGGIITRWQICGEDILYLDTERFKDPNLSVRGGVPILFPICGNLPDNSYQHQGRNYTLKQHGFARDLPWQVSKQSSETAASLTLELNSNPATRQVYPFDFQLIFTYQLQGNSLKIHQKVINLSPERMPFSIGFHPYFQVTDKTRLSFDIPSSQYLDQRTKTLHSYSGNFDFNLEEIDGALHFPSSEEWARYVSSTPQVRECSDLKRHQLLELATEFSKINNCRYISKNITVVTASK